MSEWQEDSSTEDMRRLVGGTVLAILREALHGGTPEDMRQIVAAVPPEAHMAVLTTLAGFAATWASAHAQLSGKTSGELLDSIAAKMLG